MQAENARINGPAAQGSLGFRVSGYQGFRVSGVQGFRVSGVQGSRGLGFRVSGFQGLGVWGFRAVRGLGLRGFMTTEGSQRVVSFEVEKALTPKRADTPSRCRISDLSLKI